MNGSSSGRFFDNSGGRVDESYAGDNYSLIEQIQLQLAGSDTVLQPYLENVFVRAAVKAIQSGFQRMSFGFWDGTPAKEGSSLIDGTFLSDLIRRPNRDMTEKEFWAIHANGMKLDGEVYWFLANSRGKPVGSSLRSGVLTSKPSQIIPVRGSCVTMEPGDDGWPRTFRYSTSGRGSRESYEFPWGSVISFRDYDPYNILRGTGDVQVAVRPIDLQNQVLRYMDATLRNGGGPGGFILYKQALSAPEHERRQEELDDNTSTENRRRLKILDNDAKFMPNNMSPSDMEYVTLWDRMIDAILICLGVPGPVVGKYDAATYNNVQTAYRQMWTGPNGILSLSSYTEDIITNKLIRRCARVAPETIGLTAYFDHSQIDELQDSQFDGIKLALDVASSKIGVSLNDALELVGANVNPVPGGDQAVMDQVVAMAAENSQYTREEILAAIERKKNEQV